MDPPSSHFIIVRYTDNPHRLIDMAARKMIIDQSIAALRATRRGVPAKATVGFVPTMGALHDGHLSLLRRARQENDVVFASIFVNPTQFAPGEDLDKYPRQLEKDAALLSEVGVDYLFAPAMDEMYGAYHCMFVQPEGFDVTSEGTSRPGHFRGVATIVTKLFNLVKPDRAYFGQKDAAQCVLIRRLVEDLNMDVEVVVRDTVREPDGLALSSRNAYLTDEERRAAPVLYQGLRAAEDRFRSAEGSIAAPLLQDAVKQVLATETLVSEIQYISVDCKETMHPLDYVNRNEGAVVSIAVKIGSVRLIDNIVL